MTRCQTRTLLLHYWRSKMRPFLLSLALVSFSIPAQADGSYPLADGTNRASAVTLHCLSSSGIALPCGNTASPLAVVAPSGASLANQAAQIASEASTASAAGGISDAPYSGGAGSLVSLLKGLWTVVNSGISAVPVGGSPLSRSLNLVAQTSTLVFPVNGSRRYFAFQAPQGTAVWVNFLGGLAAPNGADCAYFSAGAFYESGQWVNRGAITMYAPVGTAVSAWEN